MDYYITAVGTSSQPHHHITHVALHKIEGKSLTKARVATRHEVAMLINDKINKNTVWTLKWDYKSDDWAIGAEVETQLVGGIYYLRTNPDETVTDNLLNLPSLYTWMTV